MRSLPSLVVIASLLASVAAAEPAGKASAVFQMRRVLDKPGADTEEMVLVDGSNNPNDWRTLHVEKKVQLDESSIKTAEVQEGPEERRIVVKLTDEGAFKFADVTEQNIRKQLAIVIDGSLCMAPKIQERISGGEFHLSGSFTKDEAAEMARKITSSAKKKKK
jgi:preprotein translocase subunit SecD